MAIHLKPSHLDENEWATILEAFAGSSFLSAIELLYRSDNGPLKALELFNLKNEYYAHEAVNMILRKAQLLYRMVRIGPRQKEVMRSHRMLALVRWELQTPLPLPASRTRKGPRSRQIRRTRQQLRLPLR